MMVGKLRSVGPIVVILGGYACIGLAAYFTNPYGYSDLPVQNVATWVPTGDGAATVVVPYVVVNSWLLLSLTAPSLCTLFRFGMSFNSLMQVPWYVVLPFSVIVYVCSLFGVIAQLLALLSTIAAVAVRMRGWWRSRRSILAEIVTAQETVSVAAPVTSDCRVPTDTLWPETSNVPSLIEIPAVRDGRLPYMPQFLDPFVRAPLSEGRRVSLSGLQAGSLRPRSLAYHDAILRGGVPVTDASSDPSDQEEELEGNEEPHDADQHATGSLFVEDRNRVRSAVPVPLSPPVVVELPRAAGRTQSLPGMGGRRKTDRKGSTPAAIRRRQSSMSVQRNNAQSRGHFPVQRVLSRNARAPRSSRKNSSQVFELPKSALVIRENEVVDISPLSPHDALFGDGRGLKFHVALLQSMPEASLSVTPGRFTGHNLARSGGDVVAPSSDNANISDPRLWNRRSSVSSEAVSVPSKDKEEDEIVAVCSPDGSRPHGEAD